MKNDLPAGGLHKGEGLPIGKRDKSSCSLSSVREHCKAGGKGKGVGSPSFDTLVRGSEGSFHEKQSAMPRTAGVSGNVPEERDIKKRVARWTARKINGNYLLEY